MKKKDLVTKVAQATGFSKKDITEVVNATLDVAFDTLRAGDELNFTGFGKLYTIDRPARVGRNPKTGEAVDISAKKQIKFRPSNALKAKLNGLSTVTF